MILSLTYTEFSGALSGERGKAHSSATFIMIHFHYECLTWNYKILASNFVIKSVHLIQPLWNVAEFFLIINWDKKNLIWSNPNSILQNRIFTPRNKQQQKSIQLARTNWDAFAVMKGTSEKDSEVCFIWTKHTWKEMPHKYCSFISFFRYRFPVLGLRAWVNHQQKKGEKRTQCQGYQGTKLKPTKWLLRSN